MQSQKLIERFEKMDVSFEKQRGDVGYYAVKCTCKENGKVIAQGVAICSAMDYFDWKEAKARSLGRAKKAIFHKEKNGKNVSLMPVRTWLAEMFKGFIPRRGQGSYKSISK